MAKYYSKKICVRFVKALYSMYTVVKFMMFINDVFRNINDDFKDTFSFQELRLFYLIICRRCGSIRKVAGDATISFA